MKFWKTIGPSLLGFLLGIIFWDKWAKPKKVIHTNTNVEELSQENDIDIKNKKSSGNNVDADVSMSLNNPAEEKPKTKRQIRQEEKSLKRAKRKNKK